MILRGRLRRRHDRWRMVQRAVRLFRRWDAGDYKDRAVDARGLSVKRRPFDPERKADHLASCLCVFCRNPRTYAKGDARMTWRERRQALRANDSADECPICWAGESHKCAMHGHLRGAA